MGVHGVSGSDGQNPDKSEIKIKRNKDFDPKLLNAFDKNGDGYLRGDELTQFNSIWGSGDKNINNEQAQSIMFRQSGANRVDVQDQIQFNLFNKSYTIGGEVVGLDVLDNSEIDEALKKIRSFLGVKMDKAAPENGKSLENILTGVTPKKKDEHKIALAVFDKNGDGVLSEAEFKNYEKWADEKTGRRERRKILEKAVQAKEAATGITLSEDKINELAKTYGLTPEAIKKAAGSDNFISKAEIEQLVNDVTSKLESSKHQDKEGGFNVVNKAGISNGSSSYEYDAQGHKTKQINYDKDGKTSSVSEYDSEGNETKSALYKDNAVSSTYEYGSPGRLTKMELYKDGKVVESFSREYDSVGNLVKETTFDANGKETKSTVTKPDAQGKSVTTTTERVIVDGVEIVKETVKDASGKETVKVFKDGKITTEYEVNEKGEVVKKGAVVKDKETEKPSGDVKGYFVKNGESLSSIARKFGCTIQELKEANPGAIKKFGSVEGFLVNQKINIPKSANSTPAYTELKSPDETKLSNEERIKQREAYKQAVANKKK